MGCRTAVLDLRQDDNREEKPLMLREVLFCPVLTWVCRELIDRGVERCFVLCDSPWLDQVRAALDDEALRGRADVCDDPVRAAENLSGDVLVFPVPVVPVPAFTAPADYTVSAEALRAHLAVGGALAAPPVGSGQGVGYLPVRTAAELGRAGALCRELMLNRLMEGGVTVIDPAATYVDPRCAVGSGTVLLPGTILRGHTAIGGGCEIGPNAMVRDSAVGEGTTVNASQVNESVIGAHTTVGPFAYVRPNCRIGDRCRVGDFVEMKNSVIGEGTKVSHLTYVGDSDVGARVNFGCGTVTTNFDGHKKYRCTVGDDVFLGCNTNLIAPVTVGDGAYTAAGSTITADVPAGALGIARSRQENKSGWATRLRKRWKQQ